MRECVILVRLHPWKQRNPPSAEVITIDRDFCKGRLVPIAISTHGGWHLNACAVLADVARNLMVRVMETYWNTRAMLAQKHATTTFMLNAAYLLADIELSLQGNSLNVTRWVLFQRIGLLTAWIQPTKFSIHYNNPNFPPSGNLTLTLSFWEFWF